MRSLISKRLIFKHPIIRRDNPLQEDQHFARTLVSRQQENSEPGNRAARFSCIMNLAHARARARPG